jgi:hypothetical protein
MKPEAFLKRGLLLREKSAAWIAHELTGRSFRNMKSRTPKPDVWLMRGAQPATSAGARPFAGSPIPAFLTTLQRGGEEINLELAIFQLPPYKAFRNRQRESSRISRVNVFGKPIALRWISFCRKHF